MPDDPLDALNQPAVNELSPTVIQPMEQPVAAGENPVVIAEIDAYKETPLGGREYLNAPGLEVDGPFLEAYERNGGPRSFLGLPTSKRHGSFDGARAEVQTFAGGTLIRALDQQMAYALTPPLAAAWSDQQLWNTLGFPVGDDKDLDEHHGRCVRLDRGQLVWWPDGDAVAARSVQLRYVGFVCFGETNGVGSDEPYFVFWTDTGTQAVVRTRVYNNITAGSGGPDHLAKPLYRGDFASFYLWVKLYEHDAQSPDDIVDRIQRGIDQVTQSPQSGEIERALFGDDAVSGTVIRMTPRTFYDLGTAPSRTEHNFSYRLATDLLTGTSAPTRPTSTSSSSTGSRTRTHPEPPAGDVNRARS